MFISDLNESVKTERPTAVMQDIVEQLREDDPEWRYEIHPGRIEGFSFLAVYDEVGFMGYL